MLNATETRGQMLLIGGNVDTSSNSVVLRNFLNRFPNEPDRQKPLVIVSAASNDPTTNSYYIDAFRGNGWDGDIFCIDASTTKNAQELESQLLAAGGIFVTGGDQEQLAEFLRKRGLDRTLSEYIENGGVYAGTSAGAMVVAKDMIVGMADGSVEVQRGSNLLEMWTVDTHMRRDGRHERLLQTVCATGNVGVGIDEDTAIIFQGDIAKVVGAGHVWIVYPDGKKYMLANGDSVNIPQLVHRRSLAS